MKNYEISEKYRDIAEEVKRMHGDLSWIDSVGARIGFLSCDDDKHIGEMMVHAECIKVPEIYKVFAPYDFLIVVYEPNVAHMTGDQLEILMYHEMMHCDFEERKDGDITWKIRRHDIEDFLSILEKHGLHWSEDLVKVGRNTEAESIESKEESIDG